MPSTSAGVLLYRLRPAPDGGPVVQVLLAHPGGPFWRGKDAGAWTVPKGEHDADEEPLAAARREFAEELGAPPPAPKPPPDGGYLALGSVRQSGGKRVTVWAVEGD